MYNKKLRKIFAACALATALTMAAGSVSASAADDPAAGNKTGINPTAEDYADTEIPVWGYTKDATVYSVDVEWGAMTFEYEASSWDPATHKKINGAGWKVYNSETNAVITESQDAINRVTITNHSNAEVYAKLSFANEASYSGTSGNFANTTTTNENVKATWDDTNKYFTLATASTDSSGTPVTGDVAGEPSVGNAYFTPTGAPGSTPIASLTTIGKINVAISTNAPETAP